MIRKLRGINSIFAGTDRILRIDRIVSIVLWIVCYALFTILPFPGHCQNAGTSAMLPPDHPDRLSVAGLWGVRLDPGDEGIPDKGVPPPTAFPRTMLLPGSTDQAGLGYPVQALTSLRLTRNVRYRGAVWYDKQVSVPAAWKGKEIFLYLERAHWQTRLWIDGHPAGERNSLSTPHVYDITAWAIPGERHDIRIRVDNSRIYDIGMPHTVSEETQTDWNGLIGRLELRAKDKLSLQDIQVYPETASGRVRVEATLENHTGAPRSGMLRLRVLRGTTGVADRSLSFSAEDSVTKISAELPLGDHIRLWSEFHPHLYRLEASFGTDDGLSDSLSVVFGMRSFTTQGTRFYINGQPTFIRADVNSEESPLTGYPSTDTAYWMKVFRTCREYGLNAMRFHTWCPPEAAFEAADRLGFYLQVENADWRFDIGKDTAANGFLSRESDRILRTYGNHPSFMMFCEGNELVGPGRDPFLTGLIRRWEKEDPRHLYTGGSGYPALPADQYHDFYGPRAQHWKEGLTGRLNKAPYRSDFDYGSVVAKYPVPLISHEVGQWCVYPGYGQIAKYTGVLKPYNYALFRESLRDHQMLDEAERFTMASGKFQVIQKKEELEALLRTPGLGGYQLLQLQDFPGQGTAPVGVVDMFWDPKPYTNGQEFQEFQGPRVLLLRMPGAIYTNAQVFSADAEMANDGDGPMRQVRARWSLKYPDGRLYASGIWEKDSIPDGGPGALGVLSVPLDRIDTATRLEVLLQATSRDDTGSVLTNHWSIWVYPQKLPSVDLARAHVTIAHRWNTAVEKALDKGGTVLLLADTSDIASAMSPSFSGISWNTVWSGMPPNLLGILCDPTDPVLRDFPTQYYSNWQWWDLVHHSRPVRMDSLPDELRPLVQMIPDWNQNNRIGLIFEARVGKGRLLVTSIDLTHELETRPVARQMRYSLEKYVSGPYFHPRVSVSPEAIASIFKP